MAITVVQLHREVGSLRNEIHQLYDEHQELHVQNSQTPYAIRVETIQPREWQWRVWIPDGMQFKAYCASGVIPSTGFPEADAELAINKSGEQLVSYTVERDSDDQQWVGVLSIETRTAKVGEQPWADWEDWTASDEGVTTITREFERDERIGLIRRRYHRKALKSPAAGQATEGFMIWLEPQ